MAKDITARDLMKLSFLRLGANHTLDEALGILLDSKGGQRGPRVLIVLNPDGSFAGTLTSRFLLKSLLPLWLEDQKEDVDSPEFEARLLEAMQDKLDMKVSDAMNKEVPVAAPADRLPHLINIMQKQRLDSVPVIEKNRVLGVVHITDVFNAAAQLALSALDEKK